MEKTGIFICKKQIEYIVFFASFNILFPTSSIKSLWQKVLLLQLLGQVFLAHELQATVRERLYLCFYAFLYHEVYLLLPSWMLKPLIFQQLFCALDVNIACLDYAFLQVIFVYVR